MYIIGAGGHGRVVADILLSSGAAVTAFVDDARAGDRLLGIPVLRGDQRRPDLPSIIAIGDNHARERIADHLELIAPAALHPAAVVAREVSIGSGTVVMAGAVINTGSRIGRHCIINSGSVVEHDCVIEDFASVAPAAVLGGGVRIGRGAAVSIGARVLHGRTVGGHTIIGAGAVVVRDIGSGCVAYGTPARVVRERAPHDPYL